MTSPGSSVRRDAGRHRLCVLAAWLLALLLTSSLTRTARSQGAEPRNLLEGLSPSTVSGVTTPGVLTDGVGVFEGDEWNSSLAAVFSSDRSFVEYDLGRSTPILAAFLQGDSNDEYLLTTSEDQSTWTPLWTATVRGDFGQRDRWTKDLAGHGRWVRLRPGAGDGAFSVAEVQIFAERPSAMPPLIQRKTAESHPAYVRTSLLYVTSAFAVLLFSSGWPKNKVAVPLALLALGASFGFAYDAIHSDWPLASREVSMVRATSAAIALLAAARMAFPVRWPPHPRAVRLSLLASAVMAFAAFYNLGHPQFYDAANDRPEFVHTFDMRVYQPFAKYYDELKYDGVYLASVLAYAEDTRDGSLDDLGRQDVRDLRDHQMRHVRDLTNDIRAIRKRFSDERWDALKVDMRFFEETMGPSFLGSLTDHGANATPVWVFFARALVAHAPASESLLRATGLVDAGLLLLMALALWQSFGLVPTLLAMTVFGATDIYMFGTNWTGATLRHDWLALLGFGAAALKKERWGAAGVCLGLAAMIRAFPVVALLGVGLPIAWSFGERWLTDHKAPSLKSVLEEHAGAAKVLASAMVCMVGMFLLTSILYGFSSWVSWLQKVTLLNTEVGVNEISLRSLVAGADPTSGKVLFARYGIYLVLRLGAVGVIGFLVRRRPPYQAMLLSLPLVWVLTNPSSYYSHFVFLLALLASPEGAPGATNAGPAAPAHSGADFASLRVPFLRVAFPLLAMCIAGYWVALDVDEDRHFRDHTLLLFLALGALYSGFVRASLSPPPAPNPSV